jgi:uncharacterized protein
MANIDVIKSLYAAIGNQDFDEIMKLVHDDVRWTVQCADPGPVPWFGDFRGKAELPKFFEALTAAEFTDFSPRAIAADGDVVLAWLHVALTSPSGKKVDMSEVHIWHVREGKVASLDSIEDTDAVKTAMS